LLHHENPVVRVYATYHTLDDSPEEAASLEPLLRDKTEVMLIESCIGECRSVSSLVLEALCWRSKERVPRQVLLQVARAHHHPARGGALACVAESLPDKVTLLARKQLHDSDPKLVAKAIEALGNAGAKAAAGEVEALASHPDSGVRAQVAKTLGKFGAPVGVRALAKLARDRVDFVRRAAGSQLPQRAAESPSPHQFLRPRKSSMILGPTQLRTQICGRSSLTAGMLSGTA
jgi:HEAT repeat protein